MVTDNPIDRKFDTAIRTARTLMTLAIRAERRNESSITDLTWSMAETCFDFAVSELEDEGELATLYKNLVFLADEYTAAAEDGDEDEKSEAEQLTKARDAWALAFGQEIAAFGLAVTGIAETLLDQFNKEDER